MDDSRTKNTSAMGEDDINEHIHVTQDRLRENEGINF